MPVDRGKHWLFHRATEWTVFNPEVHGGLFPRALSAVEEDQWAGMAIQSGTGAFGPQPLVVRMSSSVSLGSRR